MQERKTKTVTTPSGAIVELKEYLTAGEFIDLNDVKDGAEISKAQMAKRILDLAVVSINGSTENISDALRELPVADYIFLNKEVAKLIEGDFTGAKAPAQN